MAVYDTSFSAGRWGVLMEERCGPVDIHDEGLMEVGGISNFVGLRNAKQNQRFR